MRDYKQILPAMAVLMVTEPQYKKWLEVVWELRIEYIKGQSTVIYPCMLGDFWYNGVRYTCTMEGINKS